MTSPRKGPIASSVQNIPSAPSSRATTQRCQVAVGGGDISKNSSYPREAELLLKKCTSLILEPLCFSPWVVKMTVDFLCTNQASTQDEQSFLSWEKNENVFLAIRNPTPPRSSWSSQLGSQSPGHKLCIMHCTRVWSQEAPHHRRDNDWQLKGLALEFPLVAMCVCFPLNFSWSLNCAALFVLGKVKSSLES